MKILLTGASGFVGSEILEQLLREGHSVRVLSREANPRIRLNSQIEYFHGNTLNPSTLTGCMNGIEAVIHLVGVITEIEENTYERVHTDGTKNLIAEAKRGKVKRFIYMSALGTRENAVSRYHQSKWAAEQAVQSSGLDWTIFRPSIIYGPRDQSVNMFAKMMRFPSSFLQLFSIPLFGGGQSLMQPIGVDEVARCFTAALTKPESVKKIYTLAGATTLTFRELLKTVAEVQGLDVKDVHPPFQKKIGCLSGFLLPFSMLPGMFIQPTVLLVNVPISFGSAIAWTMEKIYTKPPLNRDQLLMLQEDNAGDISETVKDFGIQPRGFREGISAYLSA